MRDIPSNIWDEIWADIEVSYREDNERMIKHFEGNLQDAEIFLKVRLEEQRIAKKLIRESMYKKKKKQKLKHLCPIRALNEKITKALIMRKEGFNFNYISKSLGLKENQISHAIYKESLGISPFGVGKGAPLRFKPNHLDYLYNILKNGLENSCFFTYKKILEHLKVNFTEFKEKPPDLRTVIKYVKKLGFSKKKGSKRFRDSNCEQNKILRNKQALDYVQLLKEGKEFIYIDETGFNIDQTHDRGISKKNEKFLVNKSNKGRNITAICAISKKKVFGLQFFMGGIAAKDFGCFMANLINENREINLNRENIYFFLDNHKIHKNKLLGPWFKSLNMFFNAPYSSDMNPIENYFGLVKRKFRSLNSDDNVKIENKILNSFKFISSLSIERCEVHSYNYYIKALKMENI